MTRTARKISRHSPKTGLDTISYTYDNMGRLTKIDYHAWN